MSEPIKRPKLKSQIYGFRKKLLLLLIIYIVIISTLLGKFDEIAFGEIFDINIFNGKFFNGSLFTQNESEVIPDGTAKITFFDVGQGDSTLIQTSDYDILIDAGEKEYGNDVVEKMRELRVDDLEYLVATHPHSDHIGGITEVLENYEVEHFVMPNVVHTTKTYENMLDLVNDKGIDIIIPYEGEMLIDDEGLKLKVISPEVTDESNLNNYSICLRFDFGNTSAIFTGDAEAKIEKIILDDGENLDADIFQAGHHGSSTSNTEKFVEAISPQIVVISCGKDNDYGHPNSEVVDRFENVGATVYNTAEVSDIQILTDGTNIDVSY